MDHAAHAERFLRGMTVIQCRVDYAFTVVLWDQGREAILRLTAFGLHRPHTGNPAYFDADTGSAADLGPALAVCHQTLEQFQLTEAGHLRMCFSNGLVLSAAPDPQYESWELQLSDGASVICLPGTAGIAALGLQ